MHDTTKSFDRLVMVQHGVLGEELGPILICVEKCFIRLSVFDEMEKIKYNNYLNNQSTIIKEWALSIMYIEQT